MLRKVVFVLLLSTIVFSSGCGVVVVGDWNLMTYNGTWEQTFEFSGTDVSIEGANGNITVMVWDESRVEVAVIWSATIDYYQFQPIIQQDDNSLSVSIDSDRHLSGASYVVSVPQGTKLNLRSSNGRVSVSGEALATLDIQTSNGAVMVDNAGTGSLTIHSSNGLARISGWTGIINCTTSNGAITAILPELSAGDYVFTTNNGGISVSMDPSSRFQLFASTSNGSIRFSLPGNWSQQPKGTEYLGSYNGGGASLTLRSSNSNIQLLPSS